MFCRRILIFGNISNTRGQSFITMIVLNEWIDPEFPGCLTIAEIQNLKNGLMKKIWKGEETCPACSSSKTIRKGHTSSGSQRYLCRKCGKTFVSGCSAAFHHSHIPKYTWGAFLTVYLRGATLRVCSKECNVCLKTSFSMKHRIIDSIRTSEGYPGVLFYGEVLLDGCSVIQDR